MKRIAVMALAAMLIFTACGGGTTKSEAPAASSAASSKVEKKENTTIDPAIDQEKLIAEIEKQGKLNIDAHYWQTYEDGTKSLSRIPYSLENASFSNIKISDIDKKENTVSVHFSADIKTEDFYIEEAQNITSEIEVKDKEYTITSSIIEGDYSATLQPIKPFTIDMIDDILYNDECILQSEILEDCIDEYKDEILFDSSIYIEDSEDRWGNHKIIIPITRNTVKEVKLTPQSVATATPDPFNVESECVFILANGIELPGVIWLKYEKTDDGNKYRWLFYDISGYFHSTKENITFHSGNWPGSVIP